MGKFSRIPFCVVLVILWSLAVKGHMVYKPDQKLFQKFTQTVCGRNVDESRMNTAAYNGDKYAEIEQNFFWYRDTASLLAHFNYNTYAAAKLLLVINKQILEQYASNEFLSNEMAKWPNIEKCQADVHAYEDTTTARLYELRCEAAKALIYNELKIVNPVKSKITDSTLYKMQMSSIYGIQNSDRSCILHRFRAPSEFKRPEPVQSDLSSFLALFTFDKVKVKANEEDTYLMYYFYAVWQVRVTCHMCILHNWYR